MKVLVLGAGGQLGSLVAELVPQGIKLSAYTSAVCDISDAQSVANAISKAAPELIINCAAYTQVDKAESDAPTAYAVNEQGLRHLVEATRESVRIIHVSTDFVFNGEARTPYSPDAPVQPLGVYGASKRAGEEVLLELAPERSVIVRTAWVYAARGKNFLNTMLGLMRTREELSVVDDQVGAPTSARGLAAVLWALANEPGASGIYHWTDTGQASWYEFACEIQRQALALGLLERAIPIHPIATRDYPTPARRPAYSVLDCSSTRALLPVEARSWQDALAIELRHLHP